MSPGARERAFREKRRLRAVELSEQHVPNVVIAERLGVSDTAVDAWGSYGHQRKVSMAAFACYRAGRLAKLFYAPDASFTEDDFGPLLTDLHHKLGGQKVILVWDRLSAHVRSRKTKAFLAENASWLTVEPLPGYAPELNPVEQCWAWAKNGPLAHFCAANLADLTDAAGRALDQLRKRPELLIPFLRHTGLDWT